MEREFGYHNGGICRPAFTWYFEHEGVERALGSTLLLIAVGEFRTWVVDPGRYISQYGHTAWRIQDGFLGGAANAIGLARMNLERIVR